MPSAVQFVCNSLQSILVHLVQPKLCAEVNTLHILVRSQRIRCSAAENHAIVHDVCPVGDAQRFSHVMVRDEDPDAALLQMENDVLNIGHSNRIDTRKGLVEQDKSWGND